MAETNTLPQPPAMQPTTAPPYPQPQPYLQPAASVPLQPPPIYQTAPAPAPVMMPAPMPVPQQVMQRPAAQIEDRPEAPLEKKPGPPTLRLYGHSSLFYWWPVWVTGYIMALVTYLSGEKLQLSAADEELFHHSSSPGVIFFLVLFLVILVTSVSVRGMASGMVILGAAFLTVLLAYFKLWDPILEWAGHLRVHLNCGAYFWFSTLIFIAWASAFFVFDRLTYWEIKPGQITQNYVFGSGSRTFDTEGMAVEKYRGDLFRHWLIGLGAGDLHIQTMGPQREHIDISNVLFIGSKIATIQEMVAVKPDEFGHVSLK